jgi:hypothetical protein
LGAVDFWHYGVFLVCWGTGGLFFSQNLGQFVQVSPNVLVIVS